MTYDIGTILFFTYINDQKNQRKKRRRERESELSYAHQPPYLMVMSMSMCICITKKKFIMRDAVKRTYMYEKKE